MATVTTAPGVVHVSSPTVQQVPTYTEHPATRYKSVFTGVGVALVIAGILSFILGGVALSPGVTGAYVYVGSGMWGGGWYIASGALAIATGAKANSCNVIGGMVVSILTSLVAFGVGTSEAVIAGFYCRARYDYGSYYYSSYNSYGFLCSESFSGIHGTIACIAFISCILAIVHSSYCCCGGCCGGQGNYQGQVVTTTVTTVPTAGVPLQQSYVVAQPMGQPYYPPAVQGQSHVIQGQPPGVQSQQFAPYPLAQGHPQMMQGQPPIVQGQQLASYPPAQGTSASPSNPPAYSQLTQKQGFQ